MKGRRNKKQADAAARVSELCAALYQACRRQYGINLSHTAVRVLQAVSHGPVTVQGVAAKAECAANTASELLQRLGAKGLVERKRNSEDERVVTVTLTAAGAAALREHTHLDETKLAKALAQISADRRTALEECLCDLVRILNEQD